MAVLLRVVMRECKVYYESEFKGCQASEFKDNFMEEMSQGVKAQYLLAYVIQAWKRQNIGRFWKSLKEIVM